jgi:predicted ester cyclase
MSIEANKGVVRAFIEIWNSGDLNQPEDLMADECALTVSGETISCGPSAATRAIATRWRAAFLDYRFDLLDLIAEGDKAVARIAWAGVQKKRSATGIVNQRLYRPRSRHRSSPRSERDAPPRRNVRMRYVGEVCRGGGDGSLVRSR